MTDGSEWLTYLARSNEALKARAVKAERDYDECQDKSEEERNRILALADKLEDKSDRYRTYAVGSGMPHAHIAVAVALKDVADDLRALLGEV